MLPKRVILKEPLKGGFFKNKRVIKFMSKTKEYFKDIKGELKHVIWPTKNQTLFYTLIVIALSLIIAYFLGIFDFIFSRGLEKLISF